MIHEDYVVLILTRKFSQKIHRSQDKTVDMVEEEGAVQDAKRRKTQESQNEEAEMGEATKNESSTATAMVDYVSPLQCVAPLGIEASFPFVRINERPKEARDLPDFFPFLRILLANCVKPRRAKVTAIRDYPDGCFRRSIHTLEQRFNPYPTKTEQKINPNSYNSEEKVKHDSLRCDETITEAPVDPKPSFVSTQLISGSISYPRSGARVVPSTRTAAAAGGIASPNLGHDSFASPKSGHSGFTSPNHGDHGASTKGLAVYKLRSPLTSPILRHKQKNSAPCKALSKAIPQKTKIALAKLPPFEARKMVKEISRQYDAIRRNLLHVDIAPKHNRSDLYAGSLLNSLGRSLGRNNKCVGAFPGVEVGDIFYFRMEVSIIGMHAPIQGGIDYLKPQDTGYEIPIAVSIISSGGYEAEDNGDVLIYTGQGGKSGVDGKQNEDQKLERGNLAMEGSYKLKIPVRVIRGVKDDSSPTHKTYTYDGLYMIHEFWSERGKSGYDEFKFKLVRVPGQPELGSAKLKLAHTLKFKSCKRQGVLIGDISKGIEVVPVCVVNTVDNEMPPKFNYITTTVYQDKGLELGIQEEGCSCDGVCNFAKTCACIKRNCNVLPYMSNGILLRERGHIYECGENCKCSLTCANRSTQTSIRPHLEVYRTEDRRWSLRCQDVIPCGGFVCEYVGKLVKDDDFQTEYFLDTSSIPRNTPSWGDVSDIMNERKSAEAAINNIERPNIKIDSSEFASVSRFINHSNSPNLLIQCVMRNEQGNMRPHLMLFAMENIPPFQELTIDYGGSHYIMQAL